MNEKQNLLDLRQVKVYLAEKVTYIVSLMDRSRHFFRYFRLGFEPWNFDVGSNHSTIWATTTAFLQFLSLLLVISILFEVELHLQLQSFVQEAFYQTWNV